MKFQPDSAIYKGAEIANEEAAAAGIEYIPDNQELDTQPKSEQTHQARVNRYAEETAARTADVREALNDALPGVEELSLLSCADQLTRLQDVFDQYSTTGVRRTVADEIVVFEVAKGEKGTEDEFAQARIVQDMLLKMGYGCDVSIDDGASGLLPTERSFRAETKSGKDVVFRIGLGVAVQPQSTSQQTFANVHIKQRGVRAAIANVFKGFWN